MEVYLLTVSLLGIYLAGYIISVLVFKKWGKALGWGHYDPPHESYYDDYKDNNTAWTVFSIIWPIFWFINLVHGAWLFLLYINSKI